MDSSDPRLLSASRAADPAARFSPVPVPGPGPIATRPIATRPSPVVPLPTSAVPGKESHLVTVRRLKGVAILATAVTAGVFAGLVVSHPVGSSTPTSTSTAPAPASGSTATDTSQNVAPVDPFFDPNPGSGGTQAAPAFGSGGFGGGGGGGGGGGAPTFQSGGS